MQIAAGSANPVIGDSRALRAVLDLCRRVYHTRATVLITGDTGTGKELLARHIHRLSPRRDKPMLVLNCHGVPEQLLESELFGHERGAFTGAIQSRSGLFERAHGGSLLLDEVGDIPLAAQAKLLRILQDKRFTRLGGTATLQSDVRIIATTRYDLRAEAARGRFREDLFYRLNVFPVHLPPLRDRREDIPALAKFFLEASARRNRTRQSGISEEAMALLISYHWPGNVRQLQSTIERGHLLSLGDTVTPEHLPAELADGYVPPRAGESRHSLTYAHRVIVARTLHEHAWRLPEAADHLGVSVHMLKQMIKSLQLRRDDGG